MVMNTSYPRLKDGIMYEIRQIDQTVKNINDLLDEIEPEIIATPQKTTIAADLINFYNCLENIFKRVATTYYEFSPPSDPWHKELLVLSSKGYKGKSPVINANTAEELEDYLTFRHYYMNGYASILEWDKMAILLDGINNLWEDIKKQIEEFINNIEIGEPS